LHYKRNVSSYCRSTLCSTEIRTSSSAGSNVHLSEHAYFHLSVMRVTYCRNCPSFCQYQLSARCTRRGVVKPKPLVHLLPYPFLILMLTPLTAGVAQSVYCLTTDWKTGRPSFDLRQRRKDFSSSLCVQTGSGPHPSSCPMDTGVLSPGGKA
jgi:hypothetical protein